MDFIDFDGHSYFVIWVLLGLLKYYESRFSDDLLPVLTGKGMILLLQLVDFTILLDTSRLNHNHDYA